jgi:hypothetical protein
MYLPIRELSQAGHFASYYSNLNQRHLFSAQTQLHCLLSIIIVSPQLNLGHELLAPQYANS